jgi:heptosyltransferase-1
VKKVLILKMSSMGDLIHTLPAVSDIYLKFPEVSFDWVVEEAFAEIPAWHPAVRKIIPIALRRWKKNWFKAMFSGEFLKFIKALRSEKYDFVIDAQGLLKSAFIAKLAKASNIFGPDKKSAREAGASFFYSQKISVPKPKDQHAITRTRLLFSKAFGLSGEASALGPVEYGLKIPLSNFQEELEESKKSKFIIFLHGTTWESKHWPEEYWVTLGKKLVAKGFDIYLPWGSLSEKARAERIAEEISQSRFLAKKGESDQDQDLACVEESLEYGKALVLERLKLTELARLFLEAAYIIGVDTGLSHLGAALDCRAINLFGPTDSLLTGPLGKNQISLQANFQCSPCFLKLCNYPKPHSPVSPPCFGSLSPEKVFEVLNFS